MLEESVPEGLVAVTGAAGSLLCLAPGSDWSVASHRRSSLEDPQARVLEAALPRDHGQCTTQQTGQDELLLNTVSYARYWHWQHPTPGQAHGEPSEAPCSHTSPHITGLPDGFSSKGPVAPKFDQATKDPG